MSDSDRRLRPLKQRFLLVATAVWLVGLLLTVAALRAITGWPGPQSETVVLIGVVLLSLLPIVLALLDVIIERGAVIEYAKVKIDFSQSKEKATTGIAVPPNIGAPGIPVFDASTFGILDTLRQATASELVVIDLKDGKAWWETRLLVLLAGAVRLRKPRRIVFICKDANKDQQFQGWADADSLLPRLVTAHPQYARSLQSALAAARQWSLVEPPDASVPPASRTAPVKPKWISGLLAGAKGEWAFDSTTRLPNELFAEQLLQDQLGLTIEQQGPRNITLLRLEELFRVVLNKESIDLNWTPDRQLSAFLDNEAAFIALTQSGKYVALASRAALSNVVFRSLAS